MVYESMRHSVSQVHPKRFGEQRLEPYRVSRRAFYLTPASGAGVCS